MKWKIWDLKGSLFKTVELIGSENNKISFGDFEFENFERLVTRIPKVISTIEKERVYQQQAKANLPMSNFLLIIGVLSISSVASQNVLGREFDWLHLILYTILFLLTIAALRRRIVYKRIKTAHNNMQPPARE